MKIRKARKGDFESYFNLQKEFYELEQGLIKKGDRIAQLISGRPNSKAARKSFDKIFRKKNSIFLAAEEDGRMIGYLVGGAGNLTPSVRCGHISDVIISKKFRKKGFGRKLETEFLKWARKKGLRWISLNATWFNEGAKKAYIDWGYEPSGLQLVKRLK